MAGYNTKEFLQQSVTLAVGQTKEIKFKISETDADNEIVFQPVNNFNITFTFESSFDGGQTWIAFPTVTPLAGGGGGGHFAPTADNPLGPLARVTLSESGAGGSIDELWISRRT